MLDLSLLQLTSLIRSSSTCDCGLLRTCGLWDGDETWRRSGPDIPKKYLGVDLKALGESCWRPVDLEDLQGNLFSTVAILSADMDYLPIRQVALVSCYIRETMSITMHIRT